MSTAKAPMAPSGRICEKLSELIITSPCIYNVYQSSVLKVITVIFH